MADRRLNLPLFTADRQQGNHLGIAGHPLLETPNVEQFFDLVQDRGERVNLVGDSAYGERVAKWRQRLIALPAERGDGFSDGKRLIGRRESWSAVVE